MINEEVLKQELEEKLQGITVLDAEAIERIKSVCEEYGIDRERVEAFINDLERKDSTAFNMISIISVLVTFMLSQIVTVGGKID